jgi:hypothetical protein
MDMNQCKKGDKLLLRNKHIATYVRKCEENTESAVESVFDKHIIKDDGAPFEIGVSDTGTCFVHLLSLNDVVGFAQKENKEINIKLIDKVLEQIKEDVIHGDVTAIEELLKQVPIEILKSYLPEEGE